MLAKLKAFMSWIVAFAGMMLSKIPGSGLFSWLKDKVFGVVRVLGNYAPSNGLLATPWAWLKWAVLGVWRSFWAVWGNWASYPIIGVIAVLCFTYGHHEGHKGYPDLLAAYNDTASENVGLKKQINAMTKASSVVISVPPAQVVPAKEAPAVKKHRHVSSKKPEATSLFGF